MPTQPTALIKNGFALGICLALLTGGAAWAQSASPKGDSKAAKAQPEGQKKTEAPTPTSAITETVPATVDTGKRQVPKDVHVSSDPNETCEGGAILDDGVVDAGYGFFPTLEWGAFVQRFDSKELFGKKVDRVCVCFLETGGIKEVEFEVVLYKSVNGMPAETPYASAKGLAIDLPKGTKEAGRFYSVPLKDVTLPDEPSYIGVKWNPEKGNRVFLCASKGSPDKELKAVQGYQRDSRSSRWDDVLKTRDRTFYLHESALIRMVPKKEKAPSESKKKG